MKKINFSLVEKKLIRLGILFVLVQILIVFILAHLLISGRQIGVNDTKQVDISVEDVRCVRAFGENCLFIVSDSTEYLFKSRSTPNEYSVSELLESISKGDKLFLMYRNTYSVFGKVNLVVDARGETEIYRAIEEYNCGKEGLSFFVVILFSVIEVLFIGIVFVYVRINKSTVNGIIAKIKKHRLSKKSK